MRKAVRETSVISLQELIDELGARQRFVLELIESFPDSTDRELAMKAGFTDPNGIRPRRSELVAKGLVAESGKRRCRVSGKLSTTWRTRTESEQLELF